MRIMPAGAWSRSYAQNWHTAPVSANNSLQFPGMLAALATEAAMIVRIWRGWAANSATADLYEEFLRATFLPSIHSIKGYHGASVLRRTIAAGEVEFTTLTRFESLESIRAFAGDDYEAAHVAPRARELLSRFDARCQHFECVVEDRPLRE
jgi:heme-degrading monooxygenase HmoA